MKQRIRVAAIMRSGEELLLLKRSGGRLEAPPNYELPTGKIYFGEQPEEAMARILYDYLGIRVIGINLKDVIAFTNLRNSSEVRNLFIIYEVATENEEIKISTKTNRYSAYKWAKNNDWSSLNLDDASLAVMEIIKDKKEGALPGIDYRGTANSAVIYTDGGSRGNPGPSGIGYYVVAQDGAILKRGGEFIGFSTSRVAEYYGLKEGVEQAIELGLKSVRFVSDNLMMVNQMNGIYKVKNQDLVPIYNDVVRLLKELDYYSFTHVSREQNKEADREVNRAIDEYMQ